MRYSPPILSRYYGGFGYYRPPVTRPAAPVIPNVPVVAKTLPPAPVVAVRPKLALAPPKQIIQPIGSGWVPAPVVAVRPKLALAPPKQIIRRPIGYGWVPAPPGGFPLRTNSGAVKIVPAGNNLPTPAALVPLNSGGQPIQPLSTPGYVASGGTAPAKTSTSCTFCKFSWTWLAIGAVVIGLFLLVRR